VSTPLGEGEGEGGKGASSRDGTSSSSFEFLGSIFQRVVGMSFWQSEEESLGDA